MNTEQFDVLGIDIAATDLKGAVAEFIDGVSRGQARFYTARDVHGVMLAQRDPELMAAHRHATLNLPDGMPLVALGRLKGYKMGRVAGPDFVLAVCSQGVDHGLRHFFYGGRQGVAEQMAANLSAKVPGLQVAGVAAPPDKLDLKIFDTQGVERIRQARPDVVWLGLSTPKQEYWMDRHSHALEGVSVVGVGAAFDIFAGIVSRPPLWIQRSGLEWSYRLISEPKRLWRRYLVLAPQFLVKVGLRHFWKR
jgi:N-acetylglucosaminyldiphosphoundecaprenol N-acetyl-beta-D-mannosaminyltransferase